MAKARLLLAVAAAYGLVMIAHLHNPSQGYICDDLDSMPLQPKTALVLLAAYSLASYLCAGRSLLGCSLSCIPSILFISFVAVSSWHNYMVHMLLVIVAFCGMMAVLWMRASGSGRTLALIVITLTLLGGGVPAVLYHRESLRPHGGGRGLYDIIEGPGMPVRVEYLTETAWAKANRALTTRRHEQRRSAILYQRVAAVFLLLGSACALLKADDRIR